MCDVPPLMMSHMSCADVEYWSTEALDASFADGNMRMLTRRLANTGSIETSVYDAIKDDDNKRHASRGLWLN